MSENKSPADEQHLIHAEDAEVVIERYPEDWIALVLFWGLAFIVFLQFFTRYVLNDSYAWTEEIATYCLIGVVFIGSAMCVRLSRHIQVDLVFRYLPHAVGRALSTVIDLVVSAAFGAMAERQPPRPQGLPNER